MSEEAFAICVELYGECRCVLAGREPCEAMLALVDEGSSAGDEMNRIAQECDDAEFDAEYL